VKIVGPAGAHVVVTPELVRSQLKKEMFESELSKTSRFPESLRAWP